MYFYFQLVLGLLVLLALALLPKTPYFLYFTKNFSGLTSVLSNMAKTNKILDWDSNIRPKLQADIDRLIEADAPHIAPGQSDKLIAGPLRYSKTAF